MLTFHLIVTSTCTPFASPFLPLSVFVSVCLSVSYTNQNDSLFWKNYNFLQCHGTPKNYIRDRLLKLLFYLTSSPAHLSKLLLVWKAGGGEKSQRLCSLFCKRKGQVLQKISQSNHEKKLLAAMVGYRDGARRGDRQHGNRIRIT